MEHCIKTNKRKILIWAVLLQNGLSCACRNFTLTQPIVYVINISRLVSQRLLSKSSLENCRRLFDSYSLASGWLLFVSRS